MGLKLLAAFFEFCFRNSSYSSLEKELCSSQTALRDWVKIDSVQTDAKLIRYLHGQRQSLRGLKMWLLLSNQNVQGATYPAPSELHGESLKSACLLHLEEALVLFEQIRAWLPLMQGEKFMVSHMMLSVRAHITLRFGAFIILKRQLESFNRQK